MIGRSTGRDVLTHYARRRRVLAFGQRGGNVVL